MNSNNQEFINIDIDDIIKRLTDSGENKNNKIIFPIQ